MKMFGIFLAGGKYMGKTENIARLNQHRKQLDDLAHTGNSEKSTRAVLNALFDKESFIELGSFVSKTDAAESVVTGYGTISGRLVYTYAQDIAVLGGSLGDAATKKISDIIDMAIKTGSPIVSILNSNGVRIDEGVNVLASIGKNLLKSAKVSGVIPQISFVTGPCAGGAVFTAGLADFVFMPEGKSSIFLTGPAVTEGLTGVPTDAASLGGATSCAERGAAHFVYKTEDDCILGIKKLLSFLPSNNLESPPIFSSNDDVNRQLPNLISLIPDDNSPYDILPVIKEIVDDNDFFEVSGSFAQNLFTGFARLDGVAVGLIANRPDFQEGLLDVNSLKKAAYFIRVCNSFNIPILTFVDTPGFKAGIEQEQGGVSVYGASVIYAYAEATVPKISIVVRRAYGSAYLVMGAKSVGADLAFAYPTAEISVLRPETAAEILYNKDIASADDPRATRAEKLAEYTQTLASPFAAAKQGFVDDIIDPAETRQRLISALDVLSGKREEAIPKKHGNMPV